MAKWNVGAMFPELWRNLFKKPATVMYHLERLEVPTGFRGKIVKDLEKCNPKCRMCSIDCPANSIIQV